MADHHECDFKAEYAKSNRSSCKMCSGGITKDSLRLAIMVQSPMFDGRVPNWFHPSCFWKRTRVECDTQIHGYDALRWEDQQKIKDKIGAQGSAGASVDAGGGNLNDFAVEYAKSNRSTCRGCDSKIDKDLVRVSRKEFDSQRAKMYGPQDLWHHVDCFVSKRDELDFTTDLDPSKIKGFGVLGKDDKAELIKKLGKGDSKKRKSSAPKETPPAKKSKEDEEEEKKLKDQSKLLWKFRDHLQKEVSKDALKGLLEFNSQADASGESRLLDRVSDCLAFGALDPCPECKEGQLVYSGDTYQCTGNVTEWTKCQYTSQQPKRRAFKIPKEYHDVEFLKKYKYMKRDRCFPAKVGPSTSDEVSDKPLTGMKFVIAGKTSKSKPVLSARITELGGKVVSKCDKTTAAVISVKSEVEKMSKAMKDAKAADIQVVDEAFLEESTKGGIASLIKTHSLCSWGSEPLSRVGDVVDGPRKSGARKSMVSQKQEAYFTKSVPSTMKMTVKGGAAVEPESGLQDTAHVYDERGDPVNVVLGLVDISRGTNSYYKLQMLQADQGARCWVFRAWGRVGTTIGGNKLESFMSSSTALARFKEIYVDKTGNEWDNRKSFEKQPHKFYPLDIDYGGDEEIKALDATAGSSSKLPKAVQDLVKLIFDVESMKKAMLEFEIDLKKMPLGKLSKKQIESAYKILTELNKLIDDKGTATQFLDASNRFYTLIPHDFGLKKPPILDTAESIKNKTEMLDNLLEIEVAYSMLKTGEGDKGKDPLDEHYDKLNTKLEPMDKSSEDYQRLLDYTKKTHASTHNTYELEVEEIFQVARQGEAKRYRPFKDLPNRMLLWHGSRVTNYAGILSQGLRIAPPEAPVTGYMFGKGVYFADMVSKSANYCRTSKSEPTGVLLLCEVALGSMHELKAASYVTSLPKGKHSTKGCGMTAPNPKDYHTTPDGVVIPIGEGHDSGAGYSSLLYNEYPYLHLMGFLVLLNMLKLVRGVRCFGTSSLTLISGTSSFMLISSTSSLTLISGTSPLALISGTSSLTLISGTSSLTLISGTSSLMLISGTIYLVLISGTGYSR